ncbi:MAG: hypothetical protein HOV83_15905, partial [Catenulispora sp.]|nr:hypothetical protein [Catenulispora sp.]
MMTGPGEEFPDLRRWTERRPAATVALRMGGLVFIGEALVKSGQRTA